MATARSGKPYVYVTWLAKILGGRQCLWAAWFMSHFKYQKFEAEAFDLAEWNRDHARLMRDRATELEENGWTVATEDQNKFALEGTSAVVAGKPDIVATMPGHILIVDGKTGRARESDWWQVLLYLFAWPIARPEMRGALEGEIHYKQNDRRLSVTLQELTDQRRDDIVQLVKVVAGERPPRRAPSRDECARCNIGFADCPERFKETQLAPTTAAAVKF